MVQLLPLPPQPGNAEPPDAPWWDSAQGAPPPPSPGAKRAPMASNGVLFPATDYGLPEPGPQLFRISSPLPPPMIANAQSTGTMVEPGARGFGFNADARMLVRFLEVGTKVDVRD